MSAQPAISTYPSGIARRDMRCAGQRPLARYAPPGGLAREIAVLPAAHGSVLLVDRLAGGLGDTRLIGHLAADEPPENAKLLCRLYLNDPGRSARRLTDQDLRDPPLQETLGDHAEPPSELRDADGNTYRIQAMDGLPRCLRWTRSRPGEQSPEPVSLREVIGAIEAYEPARTLTIRAIAGATGSRSHLRQELKALERSPFVLNRALRAAVIDLLSAGTSMSEIALRCGRTRRNAHGLTGETTWLARRIGLKPDSVSGRLTPWVHTDVLALIARDGLGIAPADVELS